MPTSRRPRVHPNPFHYGTPVQGEHFAGREEELAVLASRVRSGINVVLLSPRRYGKTSLLLRAEAELTGGPGPGSRGGTGRGGPGRGGTGAAWLQANLLRCRDLPALVGQLTAQAYRLPGGRWHRARQAVPAFVRRLRVTPMVTFGADGTPHFSFLPGLATTDADAVIADLYGLVAEEAGRRPAAVVMDEFQVAPALGPHLPGLLKGLADGHPGVSLVLAGSKAHLMEALVTSSGAPLYGMAERLVLGPLPTPVMVDHLVQRAKAGGKRLTPAVAGYVVEVAGPVPNDIQRLAYEAFDAAADEIDGHAVDVALGRAAGHEAATYAEAFERLSPGQRRVLGTLAESGEATPYSAAFTAKVGLANPASVQRALGVLERDETVVRRDGRYVVADPFFGRWLRGAESSHGQPGG